MTKEEELLSDIESAMQAKAEVNDDGLNITGAKMPVDIPYRGEEAPIFTNATGFQPLEYEEKPGFFSTAVHGFSKQNELYAFGQMAAKDLQFSNPNMDEDLDFNPNWPKIFYENGLSDSHYWGFLTKATTQNDLDRRIEYVKAQMTNDEYFTRGSGIADFLGGALGYAFSPSSLIPVAASVKYAKWGKNFINNAARQLPGLSTQALVHNAVIQRTQDMADTKELLEQTAIDTVFGTVLGGAAHGLTKAATAADHFNARKVVMASTDDIRIKQIVDEKGQYKGLKAEAAPGQAVGADVVDKWQSFLDSRIASRGIFQFAKAQKLFSKGNPLVSGLTSRFSVMADFVNKLVDHDIITIGVERGEARPINVEEIVKSAQDDVTLLNYAVDSLYLKSNGIEPSFQMTDALKRKFSEKFNNDGFITREEFNRQVAETITNGEQHANQHINEAANLLTEHLEKIYRNYLKAHNFNEDILPPRTAMGYLMRMYNTEYMQATEGTELDFVSIVAGELKRQDSIIKRLSKPLDEAERAYKAAKEEKLLATEGHEKLAEKVNLAKERLKKENDNLREMMRDDEDLHILLDNRVFLSADEERELTSLLQPQVKLEEKLDPLLSKRLNVAGKLSLLELNLSKEKNDVNAKKMQGDIKSLKSDKLKLESKIEKLQNDLESVKFELERGALQGRINRRLFNVNPETKAVKFKDPHQAIKFRELIGEGDHRNAAQSFQDKILNYTPEQLAQSILSNYSGGERTNPLKQRSLMIPDNVLRDNGFLSNDINKITQIYTSALTRRSAIAEVYKNPLFGDGFQGVTNALAEERRLQLERINKSDMSAKQKEKERRKLAKDFEKTKEDMGKYLDVALGTTNKNTSLNKFSTAMRNYTMATRLGSMQISSLSDTGGIILKNNLFPYLKEGLLPMIRTLNGKLKTNEALDVTENAADAWLSIEHLMGGYTERAYSPNTMDTVAIGGKISQGLNKLNEVAMNLYGQTYVDNFNQRLVANLAQSKFTRYMFKYLDGSITKREQQALLMAGLKPSVWAERMTKQYKQFGGQERLGAYQSRYFDWEDYEAQQAMRNAIRREVRNSVLKTGWLDAPLWTNDPVASMIMLFHKWGFTAMNRLVLPSLQRMEAQSLVGVTMMLGLGMLVDPLRKLSRGEEFELDDDAWFLNAFSNSSLGGWYMDILENLNGLMKFTLLPNSNDRRRELTMGGIIAGAPGGVVNDAFRVLTSLWNQNTTKKDAVKAIHLLPMTGAWEFNALINKWADGLDLPDKRPRPNNIWNKS